MNQGDVQKVYVTYVYLWGISIASEEKVCVHKETPSQGNLFQGQRKG